MNHEKLSEIHLKFEALTNENFLSKVANSINLSKYIITQSEGMEKNLKNDLFFQM